MVRLDLTARSIHAHALDDIRIDGALGQPACAFDLLRLSVEHIDKGGADGFALGLWVGDPFQLFEEQRPRMNTYDIQAHFLVGIEHFFKFVFAQESIVNKNAGQVLPYRFVANIIY